MVSLIRFTKKVIQGFTLWDRTLVKVDLIILGLVLAKFFPILTSLHRGYYVGFLVLAELYFIYTIFGKK